MAANSNIVVDSEKVCSAFKEAIKSIKDENDISAISKQFSSANGSDSEKRSFADQAFREILVEKLTVDKTPSACDGLVHCAINSSKKGVTTVGLPITMISDMFDCVTVDACEDLFKIVEKHVLTWTSEPFFTAGKNLLLRTCNDLLRRLSTSQNTVFCGRIQLILTRLFPLSEKSGLNLMSQFNLENITKFDYKGNSKKENPTSSKEIVDTEVVDYVLYTKFWSLQDFFRSPTQCYNDLQWKKFVDNASAVLSAFNSHKLEHVSKKSKHNKTKDLNATAKSDSQTYFAKFLTSEKLLNLQLNDSNFRRTILVQLLIIFQYLTGEVKFKSANQKLKERQSTFVKDTTTKVYELLRETPPEGEKFAKYVEGALNREENWIAWKNTGCPSFIKEKEEKTKNDDVKNSRKRKARDNISSMIAGSKIDLGSPELTRLWNLCPDNMSACKAEKRNFLPDLNKYFEEAFEQADPESQIEEQYKLVNDPKFGWRALRLLSRKSQHFFQPSTHPFKTLPQYLELAIQQLGQELLPPNKVEDESDEVQVENGLASSQVQEDKQTGAKQNAAQDTH
ncbi:THO complex subunit 1-like [Xenia sp. Carnegie-2017]|uniref:THO complex subunit 1-like n=1 Tax=Xenia sp. Carnegie-2017 TaxID=2897299 RepID=UPI001F03E3B9|nr:THO complex subunit 1-like [Xenia sp. Carnegie-2017]